MALSVDPSIRHLDGCGCCDGVTAETPAPVSNRPGLSAIAYRTGSFGAFKETMLAAISASRTPALRELQTRDDDDFTVALADAWALSLDVLTFYQERLANESYLRTATERLSVTELARLIGYQPRPGVAASTHLAFTLETAEGAPAEVTLAPGLRVQSIPGPDETPQVFETVETITARPAWNAIPARRTRPLPLSATMDTLWLAGIATNLKTGDHLLITADGKWALRRIVTVTPDDEEARTRVGLAEIEHGPFTISGAPDAVYAMRTRTAPFGHNAPLQRPEPPDGGSPFEWLLDEDDSSGLSLDNVYDNIRAGSLVVVERPRYSTNRFGYVETLDLGLSVSFRSASPAAGLSIAPNVGISPNLGIDRGFRFRTPVDRVLYLRTVSELRTGSRASYGITGRVTQLGLDDPWLFLFDTHLTLIRNTTVYAGSESLTRVEEPITGALPANAIQVSGDFADLPIGRSVVVSGKAPGADKDAPVLRELAVIKSVAASGGITTLTFEQNLATAFDRQTVTINANVAAASHGETVSEVLGSGNAAQPYQQFTLRSGPLTWLPATNPLGAAPQLEVRVNDVLWHETPTLYGQSPDGRVYTVRQDDEGRTTVQFGDGATGARLPTGSEQVRARYRKALGKAGNVKAGQLSLLMTRPLGVKEVINPAPAEGGGEPETRDRARQNAPLTVLTLDRVVSLRDYEDFARAFTGIAKALATWTWDGQRQGIVLTIAGDDGAAVSETSETYEHLVAALRSFGDPYVPLRVRPFDPVAFRLAAVVTRDPDYEASIVEKDVRKALLAAFSFEARQFGQSVALSQVMAVVQEVKGVAGVDVDALHRLDFVGGGGLQSRLPAFAPRPGAAITTQPAELLTLDDAGIALVVK